MIKDEIKQNYGRGLSHRCVRMAEQPLETLKQPLKTCQCQRVRSPLPRGLRLEAWCAFVGLGQCHLQRETGVGLLLCWPGVAH